MRQILMSFCCKDVTDYIKINVPWPLVFHEKEFKNRRIILGILKKNGRRKVCFRVVLILTVRTLVINRS